MTRTRNSDDICALCDQFSVDQAAPEYQQLGIGLCQVGEPGGALVHVAWDNPACGSYRLDQNNAARRQYVQVQRLNRRDVAYAE